MSETQRPEYAEEEKQKFDEYYDFFSKLIRKTKRHTKSRKSINNFTRHLEDKLGDGFPIDYVPDYLSQSNTLLFCSILYETDAFTMALLDAGADVNFVGDHWARTALLCAAQNIGEESDVDVFYRIAEKTKDIDATSTAGRTALSEVCASAAVYPMSVKYEFVRILLDFGADPRPACDILDSYISSYNTDTGQLKKYVSKSSQKLKNYIVMYAAQMNNTKNSKEAGFDYEL